MFPLAPDLSTATLGEGPVTVTVAPVFAVDHITGALHVALPAVIVQDDELIDPEAGAHTSPFHAVPDSHDADTTVEP